MSVIAELSIFPIGQGASVSTYVRRCVEIIRQSGLPCEPGPMGTSFEGDIDEVLGVVKACYQALAADCERVYATVKLDGRQGDEPRMSAKVAKATAREIS